MVERLGAADFRLRVNATQPALVLSSQAFWPGWRVETESSALEPRMVNGAFLGFVAPPGDSTIRVRYFPVTIYACVAVAAVTFIALMGWVGWRHG